MKSRDFCYWLQGFFEISDPVCLNEKELKMIKNHLNLVFKHEIDPSIDLKNPEKKEVLDMIHAGNTNPFNPGPLIRC